MLRDAADAGGGEIRRDLHDERRVLAVLSAQRRLLGLERGQQRGERVVGLQLAQSLGVRRRDVDGHVGRARVDRAQAGDVVVDGARVRRVEILADVEAEDAAATSARATLARNRSTPSLLKPIRLISASASGSRKRRGLGLPGCARGVTVPHSMKPKPSVGERVDVRGVLVEARGEPDAIGERESHRRRPAMPGPAARTPARCRTRAAASRPANAISCAVSGSSANRNGRNSG